MRPLIALSLFLVVAPALAAQLCYNPRPKPACSAVVHTDFGAFALVSGDDWGDAPWREVVDWGVLFGTERGRHAAAVQPRSLD